MANIHVASDESAVQLTFETPGQEPTVLRMPHDLAPQIGAALIGSAGAANPASLFDIAQMLSTHNPRFEVKRSDAGQIVIAIMPAKMRPIVIQFDPTEAHDFLDVLKNA